MISTTVGDDALIISRKEVFKSYSPKTPCLRNAKQALGRRMGPLLDTQAAMWPDVVSRTEGQTRDRSGLLRVINGYMHLRKSVTNNVHTKEEGTE